MLPATTQQHLDSTAILCAAEKYKSQGLNAIPCGSEKRPIGTWTQFQDHQMPVEEFKERLNGHAYGLGILCGKGSGNLEVIDIDNKYDLTGNLVNDYFRMICDHDETLFNRLRIIKTPTHGFHLYYFCSEISGNQKLANRPTTEIERKETYEKRYKAALEKGFSEEESKMKAKKAHDDDNVRVLIETRGQGGFIVAPPTSGYSVWQKNPVPQISVEERDFLISAARSFNLYYEVQRQKPVKQFSGESPFDITPWDDYNEKGDIVQVLENHEWTIDYKKGSRIFFTRPGKSKGCSADYNSDLKLFKNWSTSVGGFEPEKAYNHTSVFAILNCNNDYSQAADELEKMGYGKRKEKVSVNRKPEKGSYETERPHKDYKEPAPPEQLETKTLDDFDYLLVTKEKEIAPEEPVITIAGASFAVANNISNIGAQAKGGKTAIMNAMVAGACSFNGEVDGFPDIKVKANSKREAVIVFDTEQSEADQQYNLKTILKRSGFDKTPDFLRCYNIRQLDFKSYKGDTETICRLSQEKYGGIHSIYIDGGADYIASVNDEEQSTEIMQFFVHLSIKYHCPVIVIVHQNPGSDKERGHFGSTIQRKCYGLLSITKEGEVFTLQPKMMRRAGAADVPLINYKYDKERGYHVQIDAPDKEVAKGLKHQKRVLDFTNKVFPASGSLRHNEAVKGYIQKAGISSDKTARDWLKLMVTLNYVTLREDGNYQLTGKQGNSG